jgi:hypothetical protein
MSDEEKNGLKTDTTPLLTGPKPEHPGKESTQFKPGNPGGPGVPLGTKHFTSLVYKWANAEIKDEALVAALKKRYGEENITRFMVWFHKYETAGMEGDNTALGKLLSFFINMPNQAIDLGSQKDNPLRIMNDTDLDRELEQLRSAQEKQNQAPSAPAPQEEPTT